ncbi:hypothetical protein EIQ01_09505 [Xanthomonas campestris pv. raphani]
MPGRAGAAAGGGVHGGGIGNRESGMGNRESGIGNRESGIGNGDSSGRGEIAGRWEGMGFPPGGCLAMQALPVAARAMAAGRGRHCPQRLHPADS